MLPFPVYARQGLPSIPGGGRTLLSYRSRFNIYWWDVEKTVIRETAVINWIRISKYSKPSGIKTLKYFRSIVASLFVPNLSAQVLKKYIFSNMKGFYKNSIYDNFCKFNILLVILLRVIKMKTTLTKRGQTAVPAEIIRHHILFHLQIPLLMHMPAWEMCPWSIKIQVFWN